MSHIFRRTLANQIKRAGSVIPQAPNRAGTWSASQQPRIDSFMKVQFIQKDLSLQPTPPSAMELIQKVPITVVHDRIAVCQGEKGINQGHPKIYLNLEGGKGTCGYCGLRYEMGKG